MSDPKKSRTVALVGVALACIAFAAWRLSTSDAPKPVVPTPVEQAAQAHQDELVKAANATPQQNAAVAAPEMSSNVAPRPAQSP